MAVLHYGTETFRLPVDTKVRKVVDRLTWAVAGARMMDIEVEGGTIYVAVGAGIPIWVDNRPEAEGSAPRGA